MSKKYKLIIAVVIGAVLLSVGAFFAYRNFSTNMAVKKGLELVSQKEYNKALVFFELALDEMPSDKKALTSKNMIEKYLDAKKLFDEGKEEEAYKKINEIGGDYTSFIGLKEDVDILRNQIDGAIKKGTEISGNIDKIRRLLSEKNYDEAKKVIADLEKEQLNSNQNQQVDDLKAVIDSELARIDAEKKAQESFQAKESKQEVITSANSTSITEAQARDLVNSVPHSKDTIFTFMGEIKINSSAYIPTEARGKTAYSYEESDSTGTACAYYYVDMQRHVYKDTYPYDGKCIKLR